MFVKISMLLSLFGTIGAIIGFYKVLKKRENKTGSLILSCSFFMLAIGDVIDRQYIFMIIDWLLTIMHFRRYILEKEAK